MDENVNDTAALITQVQQLEHERDELRKDIEQLCMQQAGPSYLALATRMHFQRTAVLEQEIENLKKKLAAFTRENANLQEELSEAYRIKSQLADLHHAEATKNIESEKQVKFFQGCVAAAFAERDHSVMEAMKAKEKEDIMSQNFNEIQKRLEELSSDCNKLKRHNDELQIDLSKQEEQIEKMKKVVDKFYGIRQQSLGKFLDASLDDKCGCLLDDLAEFWSYNDSSTSKYISALEEELESVRMSADNFQSKLRVGLDIENHLKKRVHELEKKQILADKMILKGLAGLRRYHLQQKSHVMDLLTEGSSHIRSICNLVEENLRQLDASSVQNVGCVQNVGSYQTAVNLDENDCQDVHTSIDSDPSLASERNDNDKSDCMADRESNASELLAQALQEKVATLLLLSQQEERHLLEKNVKIALQKKIEELQGNLSQVTNEKVKALMEFAQLKQDYRQLQEQLGHEINQGNSMTSTSGRRASYNERDGKLRNLLKNTYLGRWINEAGSQLNNEGMSRRSPDIDFARMKIEYATLKESMESIEHLTSSIHRLRLAILKVKESVTSEDKVNGMLESIDDIISEAKLVKTALGSSLPISWSAETDGVPSVDSIPREPADFIWDNNSEKIDSVCAAGFEMVELLILAAQTLKENVTKKGS